METKKKAPEIDCQDRRNELINNLFIQGRISLKESRTLIGLEPIEDPSHERLFKKLNVISN
ncbi:hypothetical protein DN407_18735 [Bacillus sp. JAS24-2]|nr:hypothetical protein BK753_05075 [Bacillus thuringiensis serovar canadensis]QEL80550.1 hypothetical protein DN407_18735 [Bacillus sp. JAS24-2]